MRTRGLSREKHRDKMSLPAGAPIHLHRPDPPRLMVIYKPIQSINIPTNTLKRDLIACRLCGVPGFISQLRKVALPFPGSSFVISFCFFGLNILFDESIFAALLDGPR